MCVIYYASDKKTLLANADMELAASENDDGVGIMYPKGNGIVTMKSKASWKWSKLLADVPENVSLAVHFRWATGSKRNHANAHPFLIANGGAALMHNGIVSGRGDHERSDTREICETELANGSMADERFRDKIGTLFSGSRVLTFDLETRHWRSWGNWHKGSITGDFAQSSDVSKTSYMTFASSPRLITGVSDFDGTPWEEAGYMTPRDWMQAEPEAAAKCMLELWEDRLDVLSDYEFDSLYRKGWEK